MIWKPYFSGSHLWALGTWKQSGTAGGLTSRLHDAPFLGTFCCEMDEELTSCLRLRSASLLRSGALAGVLCGRPLGDGFPTPAVIETDGPEWRRMSPHICQWGLHLFPWRSHYYLVDAWRWWQACNVCVAGIFVYYFFSDHERPFCWTGCRTYRKVQRRKQKLPQFYHVWMAAVNN